MEQNVKVFLFANFINFEDDGKVEEKKHMAKYITGNAFYNRS